MNNGKKQIDTPFEIVDENYSVFKETITNIYAIQGITDAVCPTCGAPLVNGKTLIPILPKGKALVRGLVCKKCNSLYAHSISEIRKLLIDNTRDKRFTLNGQPLWNYTEMKKAREREALRKNRLDALSSVDNSVALITIRYKNSETSDIIIVNGEKNQDETRNIFHYASYVAREVLSAIFEQQRNGEGELFGKLFTASTKDVLYLDKKANGLPMFILPNEISIKSGGGFPSDIRNNWKETVDALLYSPITKRYEAMHTTYDKQEQSYYVDFGLYRHHVELYGDPKIKYCFASSKGYTREWTDLNAESILKQCGYTTEKAADMSTKERQSILADLIDLGICSQSRMVYCLGFFMTSHPQDSYTPNRNKWEEDKHFIIHYKANPSRFLIAKLQ